jgi:5-formyltetrahydrofolate cyclo-ligase
MTYRDPALDKSAARRTARDLVAAMPSSAKIEASAAASAALVTSDAWRGAGVIASYLAMPDEVDLAEAHAAALGAGKVLAVPTVDWRAGTMSFVRLTDLGAVALGPRGVPEVRGGEPIAVQSIQLVLVPGVAFDGFGGRLGRGGGFYDRWLAGVGRRVVTIGVCFERVMFQRVPMESHDRRVSMLLSGAGLVRAAAV